MKCVAGTICSFTIGRLLIGRLMLFIIKKLIASQRIFLYAFCDKIVTGGAVELRCFPSR